MRKLAAPFLFAVLFFVLASTSFPPGRLAHAQSSGPGVVALGSAWNVTTVTSGSAVFATNLKPSMFASTIRISVTLGSSVPLAMRWTDGTNTVTSQLNSGSALTAGQAYTFVFGSRNSAAIGGGGGTTCPNGLNFVVQGPTTVPILWCEEVTGGVD